MKILLGKMLFGFFIVSLVNVHAMKKIEWLKKNESKEILNGRKKSLFTQYWDKMNTVSINLSQKECTIPPLSKDTFEPFKLQKVFKAIENRFQVIATFKIDNDNIFDWVAILELYANELSKVIYAFKHAARVVSPLKNQMNVKVLGSVCQQGINLYSKIFSVYADLIRTVSRFHHLTRENYDNLGFIKDQRKKELGKCAELILLKYSQNKLIHKAIKIDLSNKIVEKRKSSLVEILLAKLRRDFEKKNKKK